MPRYTSRSDDPHTHYRKTEKNRVLHGDTFTLRTASSTQLTAQQYTEYNTVRTHFTMMFFSTTVVTVDFHLFTPNSKIRCRPRITCYIYGLEAHAETSGNVRATVDTQQLTIDRAALYGVWSNSHTSTS